MQIDCVVVVLWVSRKEIRCWGEERVFCAATYRSLKTFSFARLSLAAISFVSFTAYKSKRIRREREREADKEKKRATFDSGFSRSSSPLFPPFLFFLFFLCFFIPFRDISFPLLCYQLRTPRPLSANTLRASSRASPRPWADHQLIHFPIFLCFDKNRKMSFTWRFFCLYLHNGAWCRASQFDCAASRVLSLSTE